MEHLSLEIFDLEGTGSKYAVLPEDASITINDTSDIFDKGDVWSYSFSLNIGANVHIFGSAGDMHGSRLHEQLDNRRARLWVEGLPLYLGYIKLDNTAETDSDGNVDVNFESGQKTFDDMIEGVNAREVSVGDAIIGVALNRKRVIRTVGPKYEFTLDGLAAFAKSESYLEMASHNTYKYSTGAGVEITTPYAQRWPKMVLSRGMVQDSNHTWKEEDYTNVQHHYNAEHTFCNINICYPFKQNKLGEEVAGRGYTLRLAHGEFTTDGGDNQTRFNNAPNFYLLHFIDRMFKDMKIHVTENQALDVEDLRRVFLLNYGCFYEEIENKGTYFDDDEHETPDDLLERYGQYYIRIVSDNDENETGKYILHNWDDGGKPIQKDEDIIGKVLLRDVTVKMTGEDERHFSSIEGRIRSAKNIDTNDSTDKFESSLVRTPDEEADGTYSAYLAYATGENYPNVEIREIIDAMKSMFGIRLLFSNDYTTVRIVLLRNIFRSKDMQNIKCDIVDTPVKQENNIRGFRMTYGGSEDDTAYNYKGFNDMLGRAASVWKDTSDKHDYTNWETNADYNEIKQSVSAMNKTCYVTPINGNAYIIKVDEDEDVLFPSLFETAGFMDAEDGDCTGEEETIDVVKAGAAPVIMNEVGTTFASLFTGDLKAPSPDDYEYAQKIATFARMTKQSVDVEFAARSQSQSWLPIDELLPEELTKIGTVSGKLDIYMSEGFQIRMRDNYSISNGGTVFDEQDAGLRFGIMRSSGPDAFVKYFDDPDDDDNDAWEVEQGSGAVSHPDTCDSYGNEWDYNGSISILPNEAEDELEELFPDSDAPFYDETMGYVTETTWFYVRDNEGRQRVVLVASAYSVAGKTVTSSGDLRYFVTLTLEELQEISRTERHVIIEVDSSQERGNTLVQLCALAYGSQGHISGVPVIIDNGIDNGVSSRYGRFSLKLRAEKPNPFYNPAESESSYNRRYLPISNENLRGRGLCDQFYKEYSYWVREARIAKIPVRMELAELLAIDKTKRVTVGDITGFIKKMQYTVSNETGLGTVEMEIMYI